MTQFNKAQFIYSGGYLTYALSTIKSPNANGQGTTTLLDRSNTQFIARFKYSTRDKAGFMSFLIKNFAVEEYFARHAAGESPVAILESKGYISKTVREILKQAGYPETVQGHDDYITAQMNKSIAKYSTVEVV